MVKRTHHCNDYSAVVQGNTILLETKIAFSCLIPFCRPNVVQAQSVTNPKLFQNYPLPEMSSVVSEALIRNQLIGKKLVDKFSGSGRWGGKIYYNITNRTLNEIPLPLSVQFIYSSSVTRASCIFYL